MSEQIIPFYLVCDESFSMDGEPIETMNKGLSSLHRAIASSPIVADKVRFCMIGFSTTADVLQPMTDLSDIESLPSLRAKGSSNFGAVFTVLRETIEADVQAIKDAGHVAYRPVVFFLSDGQSTDPDWHDAYGRLVEPAFNAYPKILAFGIGTTEPETLRQVANFKAFLVDDGISPAEALTEFATSMTNSIVRSGHRAAEGKATLVVAETIPGYTELNLDTV